MGKIIIHYQDGDHWNPGHYLAESSKNIKVEKDVEISVEPSFMDGVPHWFLDMHRLENDLLLQYSKVPVVFYSQPEFEKKITKKKKCLLPYAYYPKFHKKWKVEKKYDVGFIGISRDDVPLFQKIKEKFNCFIGTGIDEKEEYSKILSSCKVLLNHCRWQESNMRFFESLPIGPLVTFHHNGIEKFGRPGEDFLTYKTDEEAIEQIKKLLEDDVLRNKIEKNGRRLAKSRHTYKHRLLTILDFLGVKYTKK